MGGHVLRNPNIPKSKVQKSTTLALVLRNILQNLYIYKHHTIMARRRRRREE
jgi:hypothetical protein